MLDQFANAGIQTFRPIFDWQDADWQYTIDVNLTGPATPFAPLRRV